jgi:glyoxylase-like metal-dependent hydrolase (beta-lactamase superfamily II)
MILMRSTRWLTPWILPIACAATASWSPTPLLAQTPEYEVHAVRYGSIAGFPVSSLVRGAAADERMDIALVFWVIRGDGRIVLFDSGFHRAQWFNRFRITDFLPPSEAVRLVGFDAEDVTDIIVSHAHWDHMGGIDAFPNAKIWIQKNEYAHYTGPAWQNGATGGGSDPDDVLELVRRNTLGQVGLIDGDDVEVLPGVRVYTGARHTFASQYVTVAGDPTYLLASDNAYLYRNLREGRPVATFLRADTTANKEALARMVELVGDTTRVIPGHDPLQFERFPTQGRVARIR